jgi:hypothetical protein
MSVINLVSPVASIVRPMIGFGIVATLILIFKPLLVGLLRAALLVLNPRASSAKKIETQRVKGVMMLNSLARDLDRTQPNLAAELRYMAWRD